MAGAHLHGACHANLYPGPDPNPHPHLHPESGPEPNPNPNPDPNPDPDLDPDPSPSPSPNPNQVLVTALALNTDLHTQGGFTHDFLTESPGPMSVERAADFAANNRLEVEAWTLTFTLTTDADHC